MDMTKRFEGLRGDAFVQQLRGLALTAALDGAWLRCGAKGCTAPATWVGMQACGAPGGPICDAHRAAHRAFIDAAHVLAPDARPYCRHCDADVDASHILAVSIADGHVEVV